MENVEFNLQNIMDGKFGGSNRKKSNWNQFASKRLLLESGQVISDEAMEMLDQIKYKWYYYNQRSDENQGNIILGLHKKDIKGWIYVVVDNQSGELKEFKTLQDAKDSFTE